MPGGGWGAILPFVVSQRSPASGCAAREGPMFPELTRDDIFRIETRRLWLRWPTARDVEAIVRLAGDEAVAGMTTRIPHPLDRETVEAFLLDVRCANTLGTGLTLALAQHAAPTRLIGIVGIVRDSAEAPHLGYWLGRPHQGAGLMSEAAVALVHAFFAYAGGTCLIAEARLDNATSRRVLEKVGLRETDRRLRDVPLRGGKQVVASFRLERADWARAEANRGTMPAAAA